MVSFLTIVLDDIDASIGNKYFLITFILFK